jgi:hypothetical protein
MYASDVSFPFKFFALLTFAQLSTHNTQRCTTAEIFQTRRWVTELVLQKIPFLLWIFIPKIPF